MDYGFKVTTNGRELIAACAETGAGLEITRVAMGSGALPVGIDLADVHALYEYVADGAVSTRSHADDRFYLTAQYSNASPESHKRIPAFSIREFMIYARHPQTGAETDLLYATLGSYYQTVPAWNDRYPESVFSFPLTMILSDEINVTVDATAGLITYDDLTQAVKEATEGTGGIVATIPFEISPRSWQDGEPGTYPKYADLLSEDVMSGQVPMVILDEESLDVAQQYGVCSTIRTYTGYVRFLSKRIPESAISGVLYLIGKASGSGGGGGYELPTATRTRLGGVKIGSGLNVLTDGTASVDNESINDTVTDAIDGSIAPDSDVEEMIVDVFDEEQTQEAGAGAGEVSGGGADLDE